VICDVSHMLACMRIRARGRWTVCVVPACSNAQARGWVLGKERRGLRENRITGPLPTELARMTALNAL
jgi:hypothetical protein